MARIKFTYEKTFAEKSEIILELFGKTQLKKIDRRFTDPEEFREFILFSYLFTNKKRKLHSKNYNLSQIIKAFEHSKKQIK